MSASPGSGGLPTASPGGQLRQVEPFPTAARSALVNSQLRTNLRRATSTIRAKRQSAVAEVDDWEELRQAGRDIKAATMANLDGLLIRFEESVVAAGGVVHWARDADEANQIVVGLVRRAGAAEVVKVKSMTTQELGTNDRARRGGNRSGGNGSGRANSATRRRPSLPLPRTGYPSQPGGNPPDLPPEHAGGRPRAQR